MIALPGMVGAISFDMAPQARPPNPGQGAANAAGQTTTGPGGQGATAPDATNGYGGVSSSSGMAIGVGVVVVAGAIFYFATRRP